MARAIKITSLSGALTVAITGPNGGTPTVYADSSLTSTTSMPATVADGATGTFWLQSPGAYTLSVKTSGGTEIAADNNSTRTVDLETDSSVARLSYDARTLAPISGDSGHSTTSSGTSGLAITSQGGSSYTLALTDAGSEIEFSSGTAVTITVPPHSSVAFPVGTVIVLRQLGAGQLTAAGGAGVTLSGTLSTSAQYGTVTLVQGSADSWYGTANPPAASTAHQMIFGSGADGSATVSGTTTLTRDMQYTTLNVTGTLNTAGYRVFAQTLTGNGNINNNGQSQAGSGAGFNLQGYYGARDSGQGGAGASGTGGNGVGQNFAVGCGAAGGAGGAGGTGGAGAAGALNVATGRNVYAHAATVAGIHPLWLFLGFGSNLDGTAPTSPLAGGTGGGGGGGDGTNAGGGGGQGGGVCGVFALDASQFTGTITANGGNGGPGAGGNAGGGGGGGGGYAFLVTAKTGAGYTLTATGGTGGTKTGTGTNGTAGNAGVTAVLTL